MRPMSEFSGIFEVVFKSPGGLTFACKVQAVGDSLEEILEEGEIILEKHFPSGSVKWFFSSVTKV